ncbi:hypothetical protein TNIN_290101 [Trichonephila inaurata madagascariensis]|uniref:Uncharacterized protein n=1 Tax=Trichonephila inaurata madagascariensis TaxID=2747483 RepID=A0A8X6Y044_9ARAC|nr:hypothetical protein TNIN_290101 [Trichonephila inaurata madagascariensis]
MGISSLHVWIKWFESLPHLSYRLDIKNVFNIKVQGKFRHQSGLLVDALGFGTTNDGNAAREFFWSTNNSLINYRES